MYDDSELLQKLRKVLERRYGGYGPENHNRNFFVLRLSCQFEGHGRASETWEPHVDLELPLEQAHWKSLTGWRSCRPGLTQQFKAKTVVEVVAKALGFLAEVPFQRMARP